VRQLLPWLLTCTATVLLIGQFLSMRRHITNREIELPVVIASTQPLEQVSPREVAYESPSTELLRLRAEVTRLREQISAVERARNSQASNLVLWRNAATERAKELEDVRQENFRMRDLTNMAPRRPRIGAWLGVSLVNAMEASNGLSGAKIVSVLPYGPARNTLEVDDIVTAIDDHPVSDMDSFKSLLATNRGGTKFRFTVLRGGAPTKVEVNSDDWPQ